MSVVRDRVGGDAVTGYPLSLPSETLPSLPSPPARSFCDLRLPTTSQRILPPFAETPSTLPFHSATSFASPNSRPRGLHPSASCPRLRLHYIFAPTLYPTSLAPRALPRSICESSPRCPFGARALPSIFDLSLRSPSPFTGLSPFGLSHDPYARPSFLF